jgi:hypothetical protein
MDEYKTDLRTELWLALLPIAAGVVLGLTQFLVGSQAEKTAQFVDILNWNAVEFAHNVKRFSHDVSGSLQDPSCRQNCSPTMLASWNAAANILDRRTDSFVDASSFSSLPTKTARWYFPKGSSIRYQAEVQNERTRKFLDDTLTFVDMIAKTTTTPPDDKAVLEAQKLKLENENLLLQNQKLQMEIAEHPGKARRFLESGQATMTWVIAVSVGLGQIITAVRIFLRSRRRATASIRDRTPP